MSTAEIRAAAYRKRFPEYADAFDALVAEHKARREANTACMTPEQRAALLTENFVRCGEGMRRVDMEQRIAERERRCAGGYF